MIYWKAGEIWEPGTQIIKCQYEEMTKAEKDEYIGIPSEEWTHIISEMTQGNGRIVTGPDGLPVVVARTKAEEYASFLTYCNSLDSDSLKSFLYSQLATQFLDDDMNSGYSDTDLIPGYPGVSVDGLTRKYNEYQGDTGKEIPYETLRELKTDAKTYIRSVVETLRTKESGVSG